MFGPQIRNIPWLSAEPRRRLPFRAKWGSKCALEPGSAAIRRFHGVRASTEPRAVQLAAARVPIAVPTSSFSNQSASLSGRPPGCAGEAAAV